MNWTTLDVIAANTHVGQALDMGFYNQMKTLQPDVLLLSEVSPRKVWGDLHAALGHLYYIYPKADGHWVDDREWWQTPVLLKRSRFGRPTKAWNGQLSPWRGGGEHGRLWPTRFRTAVRAWDNQARRPLFARSLHMWAMGHNPPGEVVDEHRRQVDDAADWAEDRTNPKAIVIMGGDINENLNSPSAYARKQFTHAGMVYSGRGQTIHTGHGGTALDGIFARESHWMTLDDVEAIENHGTGDDHKMIRAQYKVRRREVQR